MTHDFIYRADYDQCSQCGEGIEHANHTAPKRCLVCEQPVVLNPAPNMVDHHLTRSPIDPDLCLGCFMAWVEIEKFLIRSSGRTLWTLQVYDIMREFLKLARDRKL